MDVKKNGLPNVRRERDDLPWAPASCPYYHGVSWCMFCASKGAKTFASLRVVRCGNVRILASLHA